MLKAAKDALADRKSRLVSVATEEVLTGQGRTAGEEERAITPDEIAISILADTARKIARRRCSLLTATVRSLFAFPILDWIFETLRPRLVRIRTPQPTRREEESL